jgi:uncharacterized protein (TIGR03067 family)
MRWLLASIAGALTLSIGGCAETRAPERVARTVSHRVNKTDLEKLQGTWRIESSIWNGAEEPEIAKTVTIHFQGESFIVVDRDGNRQEEKIKLMPEQNPKAIDCTSKAGGRTAPGIYSLEGDTFKWCSSGGSIRIRPASFSSQPGSKHSLLVLRRSRN